jgi:hypothetical protein
MKAIALTAAALGLAALSWPTAPADAATCFRETVTGPAGHHTWTRGCTVARHHAMHASRRMVRTTTRVVTTDDYATTPVYRTRTHRYYSVLVPRQETLAYGSSSYYPASGSSYQSSYAAPCPASAQWGYRYYYGSAFPPTCEASASSHPAFYGGSGQYTYHPGLGWGY